MLLINQNWSLPSKPSSLASDFPHFCYYTTNNPQVIHSLIYRYHKIQKLHILNNSIINCLPPPKLFFLLPEFLWISFLFCPPTTPPLFLSETFPVKQLNYWDLKCLSKWLLILCAAFLLEKLFFIFIFNFFPLFDFALSFIDIL